MTYSKSEMRLEFSYNYYPTLNYMEAGLTTFRIFDRKTMNFNYSKSGSHTFQYIFKD
jgi:hypothetical protein